MLVDLPPVRVLQSPTMRDRRFSAPRRSKPGSFPLPGSGPRRAPTDRPAPAEPRSALSAEAPARTFSRPASKPFGKPFGKPFSKPFAKPAGRSFERPAARSFENPPGRSFERPAERPFGKPAPGGKPFAKPFFRPGSKPVFRPGSKPVSRPVSRPVAAAGAEAAGGPAPERAPRIIVRRPSAPWTDAPPAFEAAPARPFARTNPRPFPPSAPRKYARTTPRPFEKSGPRPFARAAAPRPFAGPPAPRSIVRPSAPAVPVEPSFPEESEDVLPTIYLRPGEADRVLAGHPWIYEGCILRQVREPEDGGVVQVKDHRRRLLGTGFYNSKSKIRVRLLSSLREELDEAFFTRRIEAAVAHRRRFMPDATSYRAINSEGDLLSGLIVDKYEDVLVVQMSSLGMDRRKDLILRVLQRILEPRAILERNDMGARKFEGLPDSSGVLTGTLADAEQAALAVRLNGLQFEINLQSGHKTGLYLDQQANHRRVAQYARGARVLDAFSFLGGFGLHAAAAGAKSVLGIDQSAEAVAVAGRLAERNGLAATCTFEAANVFDWLRERTAGTPAPEGADPAPEVEGAFDLVILDPPSFTRNRASVPDALRGYKEIHLRAFRLVRPGGIVATFCCSHHVDARLFEETIGAAAYDARRRIRRLEQFSQSPDHPILPAVPETEYLKGYAFELLAP